MPCYSPITGYRSVLRSSNGKRPIVFDRRLGFGPKVTLPCGQCIGCRLERSRQWAVRCVHEASLYDSNCFLTLTYNDEHLPKDRSLNKKHFQDFMKRLRSRFAESVIRYYHCGEYGEVCKFCRLSRKFCRCVKFVAALGRPHYHACLFNFDFLDKVFFDEVRGNRLYTSASLDSLWPMGYSTVGAVTFESAAYVARYILKKVNGDRSREHYSSVDSSTGELFFVDPEYTTMSRGGNSVEGRKRGGIGREWYEHYKAEVFPNDSVIVRGKDCKPPRFYDQIFEVEDPEAYAALKLQRAAEAVKHAADCTADRLRTREVVKTAQVGFLKRGYENEV